MNINKASRYLSLERENIFFSDVVVSCIGSTVHCFISKHKKLNSKVNHYLRNSFLVRPESNRPVSKQTRDYEFHAMTTTVAFLILKRRRHGKKR